MGRVPERDANNYFSMAGSDMTRWVVNPGIAAAHASIGLRTNDCPSPSHSTLACPTRTDVHVSRLRPEDFKGELQLWPYPKEYSQCYFKPHESLLQAAKGPDGEDGWYGLPNAEIGGVIGSIECQKIGDHARQDLVGGDCTILKNDKVDCPAGCDQCGSSRRAFIGCRW